MRILYIQPSWVPPPANVQADRFLLLSERLEGDVLQPVWFHERQQVEAEFGPGSYPEYTRGRFTYHWFLCYTSEGKRRSLGMMWFFLLKGLQLHRQKHYDCIVVYSYMIPGLVGAMLKLLTGAKLIVEIMTAPELSFLYEHPTPTVSDRLKRFSYSLSLHASVFMSDRVHLLYKTQLQYYPLLRRAASSVFHDFVPVSLIQPAEGERDRVVLLVGAPWYLKGADLLIAAFRKVSAEFPDVTLRIQGYNPDSAVLEALSAGVPRVEIVKAVANPETLRRISRALILAHPSRCDGVPRVILEAMGAAVPVLASDAGGIPSCVRHGENGLMFSSGNVDELAMRLRELLRDAELREKLGRKGYELAHTQYSERVYAEEFEKIVNLAVQNNNP